MKYGSNIPYAILFSRKSKYEERFLSKVGSEWYFKEKNASSFQVRILKNTKIIFFIIFVLDFL